MRTTSGTAVLGLIGTILGSGVANPVDLAPGSTLSVNTANDIPGQNGLFSVVLSGSISDSGNLTTTGTGNVILSGNNTFSGTTTAQNGTLTLANSNALQNSTLQAPGGTVVFNVAVTSHTFVLGGLSGVTTLTLQDNALTPNLIALVVGNNNSNQTFSVRLYGGSSVTKVGAGMWTVNSSQASTGPL